MSTLAALTIIGCSTTPPEDVANSTSSPPTKTTTKTATEAEATKEKNGVTKFVNSKIGLEGELKTNYVDFSFEYPATWKYKREEGDPKARNFVKVEHALEDKTKGNFTLENFAVGYFKGTGDPAKDTKLLPVLAGQLSAQFAQFPNYKKVSQGPVRLGDYSGYDFRFQSRIEKTARGPITLWGRAVLLPSPKKGGRQGVALVMLASNLAPEIKSAADVGVKGQLPIILKSFKFE